MSFKGTLCRNSVCQTATPRVETHRYHLFQNRSDTKNYDYRSIPIRY